MPIQYQLVVVSSRRRWNSASAGIIVEGTPYLVHGFGDIGDPCAKVVSDRHEPALPAFEAGGGASRRCRKEKCSHRDTNSR